MEKEQNELTKEDLLKFIRTQRKLLCMDDYLVLRKKLLYAVERVLDLKELMKIIDNNHSRTKKILKKYIKSYKKETDIRKLLKKQEKEEKIAQLRYVYAVKELMEIVYEVLSTLEFEKDLPALEKWYEFELEDMVLVNDMIKGLKYYNSSNINEDIILESLNYAIARYIKSIEDNSNYINSFEKSFPFVRIKPSGEESANE